MRTSSPIRTSSQYFNTEQGKEINDLVALYVHALADQDE
jgi:hypothetical protein